MRLHPSHSLARAIGLALLLGCGDGSAVTGTTDGTGSTTGTATGTGTTGTPTSTTDCTTVTANAAKVACLATAFTATLSSSQASTVQVALTAANAARWSNLPTGGVARNGLRLADLSTTQVNAALLVVQAALSDAGFGTVQAIRAADSYLGQSANGYGEGLYYIAYLGTPSTTGTWMLQFGGHHLAINVTYTNGAVASATPNFVATEPQTFTLNGTTYAPLTTRRDALYAALESLDATQLAAAKLSSSFDDVLVGPGKDGQFPATQQGVVVSTLSASQQALVKTAIEAWVKAAPDSLATAFLADYESDAALAQTRIAYATAASYATKGSYVRIDGPRVWIEFVCQGGVVYPSQIHFHTIWRDKTKDYGGSLSS